MNPPDPSNSPTSVTIVEVGPRDGLQNEASPIPTADKIAFIDRLSEAGLPVIEITAFVSPRWVPQMGDAAEVAAGIRRRPGTTYSALVPNLTGLDRAMAAGLEMVAVMAAASETFSRNNLNRSVRASLDECRQVIAKAHAGGLRVRGYLSTAFGCPFEGEVPPARVLDVAVELLDLGTFEVAVSDTIGVGHPGQVRAMLDLLLAKIPADRLALHFHDTRGMAAANVLAALDMGIRTFDASAGGLGGCPYAPGAAGNLATEDLLYLLNGLGRRTGADIDAIASASSALEPLVGHPLPSKFTQAWRSSRTFE
jgi:isopropylmalate/homocitrate/citramalate synthase